MWDNIEDMNDDIELLCAELSLMDLTSLNTSFAKDNDVTQSLELVQDSVIQTREKLKQSTEEHNRKRQARRDAAAKKAAEQAKAKAMKPWTREELSALAKGVKKYPPGGGNQWDNIATSVNDLCRNSDEEEDNRRNREECIEAYNTAASQGPAFVAAAAPTSSSVPATKKATNATSSEEKKTKMLIMVGQKNKINNYKKD
uniref:Myb-like domain-containing protein n=1 Tax=Ditylum brightwellii TaxID=49249 RepID=A0A7S4REM1_9STRA